MNYILFPTAKIVTQDLQDVGRFPAIIYPVDQMRMIDIFKKYYFDDMKIADRFEIVTYEADENVRRKIGDINDIQIDKLDIMRDIGYSVWYGMEKSGISEEDRLIINFADVVDFSDISNEVSDRLYYAQEDISSKWIYFDYTGGEITRYYEKPLNSADVDTTNMLIGIFHISNPMLLKSLLWEEIGTSADIDSFWRAVQRYSRLKPFEMVDTHEWFDIGHIDKYYDMKMAIKSRTFNHITIDKNRGILRKTSDDREKFIGEIKWYLKLPTDVEYTRPRIFSYSTEYETPFVSMEYYSYRTLHEIFLFGDLTEEQWCNVFRRIRFIINDYRRYSLRDKGIRTSLYEMYVTKTLERLNNVIAEFDMLDADKEVVINGVKYLPLSRICELLPTVIEKKLCNIDEFHIIHGDLCFSNIMIDPSYSFIKVIDPRGKFGKYDIYGDSRYELAKLMHSIDGKYDYIIKDKFRCSVENNKIEYQIVYNQNVDIYRCFERIFEDEMSREKEEIELIEALLFLSMAPLHKESRNQQYVMLSTGIELLNKVVDVEV